MARFGTIAIVGTGLIGGSIGLAVKKQKLARRVIGISRTAQSIVVARKIGAIDEGYHDLRAIGEADFVILCLPVGEIIRQAKAISAQIRKDCIVCDAGSTKEEITRALAPLIRGFIGSHPLAGSEKRGIGNASAGLFRSALCIVTRTRASDPRALRKVREFWSKICLKTTVMDPGEHDKVLALVSHLPHAAAYALVNTVTPGLFRYAASGFRDTTRLAGSDEKLWADIFLSNKRPILRAIEGYEKQIAKIRNAISSDNAPTLRKLLGAAKTHRLKLVSS